MLSTSFLIIIFISIVLGCITLFYWLRALHEGVPEDDREFMDPLPKTLNIFWPIIRVLAYYLCLYIPFNYLKKIEDKIQKNGVSYLMIAEEFIALKLLSGAITLAIGALSLLAIGEWNNIFILIFLAIGFFYPDIWMKDLRKRQVDSILRTLPAYLDFISMAVQAGLNFSGAISQARKKGPKGPLVNEFGIVLRDLRSGIKREHALKRMSERLDINELTSFVNAVVQAEKMGSGLGRVLKIQAEQRRSERFQRAETKAMEAPVKLVGPLILFIFPTTFIILAFPIAMKFLHEGFF